MNKLIYALLALGLSHASQAEQYCPPEINTNNKHLSPQSNDTVRDSVTKLIWKRCTEGLSSSNCTTGSPMLATWAQALQHVADVNADAVAGTQIYQHLGYSDWRLPNIKELASIVDLRCTLPSSDNKLFPNLPHSSHHWTSSPATINANSPSSGSSNTRAWSIEFVHGQAVATNRAQSGYIHLVRTAP